MKIIAQISNVMPTECGIVNTIKKHIWSRQDFYVRFYEDNSVPNYPEYMFSLWNRSLNNLRLKIGDIIEMDVEKSQNGEKYLIYISVINIKLKLEYEKIQYELDPDYCPNALRMNQYDPISCIAYDNIDPEGSVKVSDPETIWKEVMRIQEMQSFNRQELNQPFSIGA